MKSIKTLSLLAVGLIAVVIFSFKNAEPVVEYGIVDINAPNYQIIIGDKIEKINPAKGVQHTVTSNQILNDLSKQGWRVIGIAGSSSQTSHLIYIERKQN